MRKRTKILIAIAVLMLVVIASDALNVTYSCCRSENRMSKQSEFYSSYESDGQNGLRSYKNIAIVAEPGRETKHELANMIAESIRSEIVDKYQSPGFSAGDDSWTQLNVSAKVYASQDSARRDNPDCLIEIKINSFHYPLGIVFYRCWNADIIITGQPKSDHVAQGNLIHLGWKTTYQPDGNMTGILPCRKLMSNISKELAVSTVQSMNEHLAEIVKEVQEKSKKNANL
jgi:hypothetical protein